jgi:hypothetical protein
MATRKLAKLYDVKETRQVAQHLQKKAAMRQL